MEFDKHGFEVKFRAALRRFWDARAAAKAKGKEKSGRGEATTAGHLDSVAAVLVDVMREAGLTSAGYFTNRKATVPGFFRPAKQWDIAVVHRGDLVLVVELKSQVGSYGNDFNKRVEEALGSAADLQSALTEGVLAERASVNEHLAPFRGWLMVLAKEEASVRRGGAAKALFPVDPAFLEGGRLVSYAERYRKFTSRLVQTRLYDAAAVVLVEPGSDEFEAYGLDSFLRELFFFAAKLAADE